MEIESLLEAAEAQATAAEAAPLDVDPVELQGMADAVARCWAVVGPDIHGRRRKKIANRFRSLSARMDQIALARGEEL